MSLPEIIYMGPQEGYESVKNTCKERLTVKYIESNIEDLSKNITGVVGIIDASMKVNMSDELIHNSQKLKVISCATTGSDHIARDEINKRGIAIYTLREDTELLRNITPAAELSFALLLACARSLSSALSHVNNGKWDRVQFPGVMLNGKTIGIIGCGRIGGWMAKYAAAFGMKVYGYDPHVEKWPDNIIQSDLEKIFSISDFVSIHVHLSKETENIITRELIDNSKRGLIIINTSRGGVIDEGALLEGLKSGQIGAAGLDVLKGEPDICNHPLVDYAKNNNNLLITPHCGGYSPDAVRIVSERAAEKILDYLE
jgi:D-3-phosphoglycerate dehydrogenase / 2-oxoglutarate reductase